jgi:hypothetical protein
LPRRGFALAQADRTDIFVQPMPDWVVGADPEPPEQEARGPPDGWFEGIDPPCPED